MLPWFVAAGIIVVGDAIALLLTDEGPAELAQQAALVVIPLVALGLTYLTFRSQE
jgi:threonine/homoserine/homoserine lactone efflux protein